MLNTKLKKNNSGLSLLLSILILSGVLIVGLAAADLVLRVGQASRKIGSSEVAYYAAEAAAEDALYHIEVNDRGLDGWTISGSLDDVAATWTRDVSANTRAPSTVEADDSIWTTSTDEISNGNPLKVRLTDGGSFELDLNINGADYPPTLQIDWIVPGGSIVVEYNYNQSDQEQDICTRPLQCIINQLNNKKFKIRIVNNTGSTVDYTLTPTGNNPLPIGIIVSTSGFFLDQERQLELESKKWQIY